MPSTSSASAGGVGFGGGRRRRRRSTSRSTASSCADRRTPRSFRLQRDGRPAHDRRRRSSTGSARPAWTSVLGLPHRLGVHAGRRRPDGRRSPGRSTPPAPATRRAAAGSSSAGRPRRPRKPAARGRSSSTLARRAYPAAAATRRRRHADGVLPAGPRRAATSRPASSRRSRASSSTRSSSSASSGAGERRAPARPTASATSSWRRGCRSSCGAASRTTSCSTLAAKGRLHDPAVLEQQVRRMLADPKSRRAGRQLRRPVAATCASSRTCRPAATEFDDNLRQAFRRETELLFETHRPRGPQRRRPARRRLHVRRRAARAALRHPERPRQLLPPRRRCRRQPAPRPARPGQHADGDVGRQPHVAGHARQVDSREPARRAGAGAAAGRRDQSREGSPSARQGRRRCASGSKRTAPTRCCASCHKIMDPIGFALENFDLIGQLARRRRRRAGRRRRPAGRRHAARRPGRPAAGAARAARDAFVDDRDREAADLRAGPAGASTTTCRPCARSCARAAQNDYRFSSLVARRRGERAVSDEDEEAVGAPTAMAFITKKHLSRRTFLRGAGVTWRCRCSTRWCRPARRCAQTAASAEDAARLHLRPARRDDGQVDAGGGRARASSSPRSCSRSSRSATGSTSSATSSHPQAVRRRLGGVRITTRGGGVPERRARRSRARRRISASRSIRSPRSKIGQDTPLPSLELTIEDASAELRRRLQLRVPQHDLVAERRPRRCRWRTTRRWCSSGCSATAAPTRERAGAAAAVAEPARFGARRSRRRCRRSCRPADRGRAATVSRRRARDRAPRSRRPTQQLSTRPRRCRTRRPACPKDVRGAHQADVRPAGARLAGGHHAHLDADARARRTEQRRLPEERRPRRVPQRCRTTRTTARTWIGSRVINRYHVTMLALLPRASCRRRPTATARCSITRWCCTAAAMSDGNQHNSRSAADRAGRRRVGPAEGRASPPQRAATRRCRTCCWRCSTSSACRPRSSATARG